VATGNLQRRYAEFAGVHPIEITEHGCCDMDSGAPLCCEQRWQNLRVQFTEEAWLRQIA
jgi:hypothetical protein